MDFVEVIKQARALLQSEGRMTYRTLKRQFALDDEALNDLTDELLFSDPQISEIDGRGGSGANSKWKTNESEFRLFLTLLGQPPRLGELGLQESRGWRGQIGVS